MSDRYLAPRRGFPHRMPPPTVDDDLYTLAITIWELYTGKDALMGEDMEDLLQTGKTVDLEAVEDSEVRSWIGKLLLAGGAQLPLPHVSDSDSPASD